MVPRDLDAILVAWPVAVTFQMCLVNHMCQLLVTLHIWLTTFPSRFVEKVVLLGIHGYCHRVRVEHVAHEPPINSVVSPMYSDIPRSIHFLVNGDTINSVVVVCLYISIAPLKHFVVCHNLLECSLPYFAVESV